MIKRFLNLPSHKIRSAKSDFVNTEKEVLHCFHKIPGFKNKNSKKKKKISFGKRFSTIQDCCSKTCGCFIFIIQLNFLKYKTYIKEYNAP